MPPALPSAPPPSSPNPSSSLLSKPEHQSIKDTPNLVNDADVLQLLLEELLKPEHRHGVVIDGFPRTPVGWQTAEETKEGGKKKETNRKRKQSCGFHCLDERARKKEQDCYKTKKDEERTTRQKKKYSHALFPHLIDRFKQSVCACCTRA